MEYPAGRGRKGNVVPEAQLVTRVFPELMVERESLDIGENLVASVTCGIVIVNGMFPRKSFIHPRHPGSFFRSMTQPQDFGILHLCMGISLCKLSPLLLMFSILVVSVCQ